MSRQELEELRRLEELEARAQPVETKGMFGRIGEDIMSRAGDVAEIQAMHETGQISKPAEIAMMAGKGGAGVVGDIGGELLKGTLDVAAGIDEYTGGFVGGGLSRVGSAIGSLPSIGGGTIGEKLPQEIEQVNKAYDEFAEEHPVFSTSLESGANLLMLAPVLKYGEDIISATGKLQKKVHNKELMKLTSGEARKKGSVLFSAAEESGGGVKDRFWKEYIDDIVKSTTDEPEIVQALRGNESEVYKAINRLKELDVKGQSYNSLKKMQTALGNYAEAARDLGAATPESRMYEHMKHALVDKLENAPDDLFVGGKQSLELSKEGRKYWAASFRLDEVERVIQRSVGAAQPSTVMVNGFRKIRDTPKLFNKYSNIEKDAIRKAAKTGKFEDVLKGFSTNLMPMITATTMAGTGGAMVGGAGGAALGIASATAARQGAKSMVEAIQLRKAQTLKKAIREGIDPIEKRKLLPAISELSTSLGKSTRPIAAVNAVMQETSQNGGLSDRAKKIFERKRALKEGNK